MAEDLLAAVAAAAGLAVLGGSPAPARRELVAVGPPASKEQSGSNPFSDN